MPVEMSAEFDKAGANALMAAIHRDAARAGGTLRNSLAWGGRKVAESLGAQTPKGRQTLRKVIENPDPRWKTDTRRAQFGVMKLRQDKPPAFLPIYRTGEHGKIRFKSKTTGEMLVRDRETGEVRRQSFELGKGPDQIPGIMQSPKRKIGRRGFAKKSWRFLTMRMNRGGPIIVEGIPNMGEVVWTGGTADPTIRITNRVSYIEKILTGSIGSAMAAAAAGMMHQIENNIRKTLKTT